MFVYFLMSILLVCLFIALDGRFFDRRVAWISGVAVFASATLFPFIVVHFGLAGGILCCLFAACLVGLGTARSLRQPEPSLEAAIPFPVIPALPGPLTATAALPPGISIEKDNDQTGPAIPLPQATHKFHATEIISAIPLGTENPLPVSAEGITQQPEREQAPVTMNPLADQADLQISLEGKEIVPGAEAQEEQVSPSNDSLDLVEQKIIPAAVVDEDHQADDSSDLEEQDAVPVIAGQAEDSQPDDSPADEPQTSASPENLVGLALAAAAEEDFVRAATLFTTALREDPAPALRWVVISELSSIYQHLGQYHLARVLIGTFLAAYPDLDHPLIPVLRQKQAFCRSIERLLLDRGNPGLAYALVPEDLRRLAFQEALATRVA